MPKKTTRYFCVWTSCLVVVAALIASPGAIAEGPAAFARSRSVIATLPNLFTAQAAAPEIEYVSPDSSHISGGVFVFISGSSIDFTGGTPQVFFGGAAATDVENSEGRGIRCTVPAGAVGTVDVQAVNPDSSSHTLAGGFTYLSAPEVTEVSPFSGTILGGDFFLIHGAGFMLSPLPTVTIGGELALQVILSNSSGVRIECLTPPHAAGKIDVVVTNSDGPSSTLPDAFEYILSEPEIDRVTPNSCSIAGGLTVTVSGTELGCCEIVPEVSFGDASATNVERLHAGYGKYYLECTVPMHAPGTVDVRVVNADGASATLEDSFTYTGPADTTPPVISLWGTNPTIIDEGSVFEDPGAVANDNIEGNISSRIEVTGTVDVNTPGTYVLRHTVTDYFGNIAQPVDRTVYVDPIAPTVTVVPETLPEGGLETGRPGIAISVEEDDFPGAVELTFVRADTVPEEIEVSAENATLEMLPSTAFELAGLSGLDAGQSLTVTLEYPDGNQDGYIDGTRIPEMDLQVFALSFGGETIVIAPIIDPVANTATFEADDTLVVLGGKFGLDGIVFALGAIMPEMPFSPAFWMGCFLAVLAIGGTSILRRRRA